MKLTVTARHAGIAESARKYATDKAPRLNRLYDRLQNINVVLDHPGDGRYTAELIVSAPRGTILVSHAAAPTATVAFDRAVAKMERQLTRLKEQFHSHTN